jgi:hypothetical protein
MTRLATLLAILALAVPSSAWATAYWNESPGDATQAEDRHSIQPDQVLYMFTSAAAETPSHTLQGSRCPKGLNLELNPDRTGADTACFAELYSCEVKLDDATPSTNDLCTELNFDPDGSGADTFIMIYNTDADASKLWGVQVRYLGVEIDNANSADCQLTAWCPIH